MELAANKRRLPWMGDTARADGLRNRAKVCIEAWHHGVMTPPMCSEILGHPIETARTLLNRYAKSGLLIRKGKGIFPIGYYVLTPIGRTLALTYLPPECADAAQPAGLRSTAPHDALTYHAVRKVVEVWAEEYPTYTCTVTGDRQGKSRGWKIHEGKHADSYVDVRDEDESLHRRIAVELQRSTQNTLSIRHRLYSYIQHVELKQEPRVDRVLIACVNRSVQRRYEAEIKSGRLTRKDWYDIEVPEDLFVVMDLSEYRSTYHLDID